MKHNLREIFELFLQILRYIIWYQNLALLAVAHYLLFAVRVDLDVLLPHVRKCVKSLILLRY